MKILELSPYFFPEQISSTRLTNDLYDTFRENGIQVEVYTPTPTRGVSDETRKKYSKIKHEKIYGETVIVNRFAMFREGKNPIIRAIRYMLVNIRQYFKGIHAKNIDIIFAASTPPTQGLLCGLVKKKLGKKYKRHVPLLFCLQDVFPDSMVQAGLTKKGSLIWKIGRKIENYTYENADRIIVISEDIKVNIMKKGVPESKISVIRNWIDTSEVHPVANEDNDLRKELKLQDNVFYVVYAGNLGKAQGIEVLIDAAIKLKEETDIKFIIFGNGSEEGSIKEKICDCKLSNVLMYPLQPLSRVSEVYSLGDVCIVSCKKGYGTNAFPSKTVSIMATATPIIAAFDKKSELCEILEKNNAGVFSEPENSDSLVEIIKDMKSQKREAIIMGENGRNLVERTFSKEKCTMDYVCILRSLCKDRSLNK